MAENGYQSRIVSSAIILGVASLGSRIIGLVRERMFTSAFGAGDIYDAFVAAFRIPDFIFNLIVVGALSAAFIPIFTEKLVKEKSGTREAHAFAISVFNVVVPLVSVACFLYAIFADSLVPLITPGFSGEKLALTIMLSRIMALQPALLAISFVLSGVLNSHKRFVAYALAPIFYNFGIIFGVLVLVPRWGLSGLAWGVVIGAALHMLVQLPSVFAVGVRWEPIILWHSPDLRKIWRTMIPRVFGMAGQQVNFFIVTIIGSTLAAGSITVFHLANNVQSLPIGIFGLAFAQAAFPTLAEYVARGNEKKFRDTLTSSFRYILFFVIPTAVLFFLLRAQTIRVFFGAGQFDWEDTILTFRTFGWLIASLFAQSTIHLLVRAFYVRHNTRTPVIISFISIIFNIALALFLAPRCGVSLWPGSLRELPCGVEGLAAAFSLSAIIQLMLLLGTLHWQLNGFNDRQVLFSLGRITLAALGAGAIAQALKYPVAAMVDVQRTFIGVFTQLVIAGGGGILAYIIFCMILKCEELSAIHRFLPKRWRLSAGTETTRFTGLSD